MLSLTDEHLLLPSGQWFILTREIEKDVSPEIQEWLSAWVMFDNARGAITDKYRSYQRCAHYHAWFEAKGQACREPDLYFRIDGMLPSLNKYMRSKGARISNDDTKLVWAYAKKWEVKPVQHYPVQVDVVGHFSNSNTIYDSTNMAGPWKVIEDTLKKMDIIVDDTPKYVSSVKLSSVVSRGVTPWIEVSIFENS